MSHEIHIDAQGKASMAFAGDVPWHGLGQTLSSNAALEVWEKEAGMSFELFSDVVQFNNRVLNKLDEFPQRRVLYRSDTGTPLASVSDSYNIVQPKQVLEFYRTLIEVGGFEMRTAGVLFGGKKYWALADIGKNAKVKANSFGGFLLLATACDGSMATIAQFTSVEVVCNNTLRMAVQMHNGETKARLSIPHSAVFDDVKVKAELGLANNSWDRYIEEVKKLADRTINRKEEVQWLIDTFGDNQIAIEDQRPGDAKIMKQIHALFDGEAKGAELDGRKGTLLGLVSATTEFYDFHTGHRTIDGRLDKAWFGETAAKKQLAWDNALMLAS